MKNKYLIAVMIMIVSGIFISFGQYFWKLGTTDFIYIIYGFISFGFGTLLLIAALKFGEVSKIQPLTSLSLVFGLFISSHFLHEHISVWNYVGIGFIFIGIYFFSKDNDSNDDKLDTDVENHSLEEGNDND